MNLFVMWFHFVDHGKPWNCMVCVACNLDITSEYMLHESWILNYSDDKQNIK